MERSMAVQEQQGRAKRAIWCRLLFGMLLMLVLASGIGGDQAWAAAPAKPKIISVTAGESQATVRWNKVSGVQKYKLYIKEGTETRTLAKTRAASSGTSYTIKKLKNNVTYTFYVSAVNSKSQESKLSKGVTAVPTVKRPGQVQNLTVTKLGKTSATLSWNQAQNASGYEVMRRRKDGTYERLASVTATKIKLKNLTEGKSYKVAVRAVRVVEGVTRRGSLCDYIRFTPTAQAKAIASIHPYNTTTLKTNSSIVYSKEVAEAFADTGLAKGKRLTSSTNWMIWVNTYTQHMYIFTGQNGDWTLKRTYICSTGMKGHLTPLGRTTIRRHRYTWYFSRIQLAYYASYISSGAIHSELYYPNGAKWSLGALGTIASHGCVRLPKAGAQYVYEKVPVGSSVWIW